MRAFVYKPISLVFLILSSLSGCSWIWDSEVAAPASNTLENQTQSIDQQSTTEVKIKGPPPTPTKDDIQVVWKIPEESVDGFVIHYGYDRSSLNQEVKLSLSTLERYEDPQNGPVYRYYLSGTESKRSVFLSISAFKDSYVSEPTEIVEVKP